MIEIEKAVSNSDAVQKINTTSNNLETAADHILALKDRLEKDHDYSIRAREEVLQERERNVYLVF